VYKQNILNIITILLTDLISVKGKTFILKISVYLQTFTTETHQAEGLTLARQGTSEVENSLIDLVGTCVLIVYTWMRN
jgi:hypothetical protein